MGFSPHSLLSVQGPQDDLRDAEEREAQTRVSPNFRVTAFVKQRFEQAQQHHNKYILPKLEKCKRAREGEYDPSKLALIQQMSGNTLYFNSTDEKCFALEAWTHDVLAPTNDRPFMLEPTPIPDLPPAATEEIQRQVVQEIMMQVESSGQPADPRMVFERAGELHEAAVREAKAESEKRADKMTEIIADQMEEGNFHDALEAFLNDLATYPIAILEGPCIEVVQRQVWDGEEVSVADEAIPVWHAVSPWDWFPAPNARNVQKAPYICKVVRLAPADLQRQGGAPGWHAAELSGVLERVSLGDYGADFQQVGLPTRADLAEWDPQYNEGQVVGIAFHGSVLGKDILEWREGGGDLDGEIEPERWYEVRLLSIGNFTPYMILNPDPIGHRPFYTAAVRMRADQIYGAALPLLMEDCQQAINAAARNMLDNLAYCAGPFLFYDRARTGPAFNPDQITPRMSIGYDSTATASKSAPMEFYQPNCHVKELMEVVQFYQNEADNRTAIPRYSYGAEKLQGAGSTYGGLSLLMDASAKGVKRVIGYVDRRVIRGSVQAMYRWNLRYHPDTTAKGDLRVVARGAMAILAKQMTQQRMLEYLQLTNNPRDNELLGDEVIQNMHKAIAQELNLDTGKLPSLQDIQSRRMAMTAEMQARTAARVKPEDGSPNAPSNPAEVAG